MNQFLLEDEFLQSLGFVRVLPEHQVLIRNYEQLVKQWIYKQTIFSVASTENGLQYLFCDNSTPNFTLRVANGRQLKDVVRHLDKGMSIADILKAIYDRRVEEVERLMTLPNNMPYLEDFRYNNIGGSNFIVNTSPDQKIFMPYEQHALSAFYYTLNDISTLENASSFVHTGNQSHPAISFWYLTLESYVNTLLKLCCIKKNKNFSDYKDKKLQARLTSVVDLLELNIKSFNQNRIIAKVNEFTQFRNELFHDRHFDTEIKFHHTAFSPIPILSCQVDVLQSLLIVLELTTMLRFAIKGLDTIPSVIIHNPEFVVWEKLNVVYQKIIQPYFEAVLKKHHLQTQLNFALREGSQFHSKVFEKRDVLCYVTVDQETKFDYLLNENVTKMGTAFYNDYLASLEHTPGKMKLNKVMLD
jgi:hypothetical protein